MKPLRMTVLSNDPVVIYSGMYAAAGKESSFWKLGDDLIDRQITFLMLVAWTAEFGSPSADRISEWRRQYLSEHPKHRIIFLGNTYSETKNLQILGCEAAFCNQNLFVDENAFRPLDGGHVKYDAVYNGQFLRFKRHHLAANIERLALIGYNHENSWYQQIRQSLSHAEWPNFSQNGQYNFLNAFQVNKIYNQSGVGLCLSSSEGAMHASMEYLLAGLPVVTTSSAGGRDYYFDGRFVRWVGDDPISIMKVTQSLVDAKIPRDFIRGETLKKRASEWGRFQEVLSKFLGDECVVRNIIKNWDKIYNDKLLSPKPYQYMLEQLSSISQL
jgi:hypothetical protein